MMADLVMPNGSVIPGDSLGPCPGCGQAIFEVVHRFVAVKDPQNNPAELELYSSQCPRCCWVRSGVNQHGKRERRDRLYWLDQRTGKPIPAAGYSLAEDAIPDPIIPVTQDEDDCPAYAFDDSLALPLSVARAPAADAPPALAATSAAKPKKPSQSPLLENVR